jgi:DNA-directed RNA polymerase II subunit RPB2
MISERKIFEIIKNFFDEKNILEHQKKSFENFITNGISEIVDNIGPIIINNEKMSYIIQFQNVYVSKPTIIENNKLRNVIYPDEMRKRDLTYDSPVYIDIVEKYKEDGNSYKTTIYRRVLFCKIPMMVQSKYCHLINLTKTERIKHGECEYDKGGYFIINGKERVLVSQVRNIYNKILVNKIKNSSKYIMCAETRSMDDRREFSISIKMLLKKDGKRIYLNISYFKTDIPIGIIFKVLGIFSKEDIKNITNLHKIKDYNYMQNVLENIMNESYHIKTKNDALIYLCSNLSNNVKEDNKLDYVKEIIKTQFIPHLGISHTEKEKVLYFGMMVEKLLFTFKGLRHEDDKDDYINKRIDTPGILCYNLFRGLYTKYLNTLKLYILKKKQYFDIVNYIGRVNSITIGFKYSMATGNWGIQNCFIKLGVSQVLSRLSYGGSISHLRRIMLHIGKEAKNKKVRQIHSSQIMYICPCESPEGGAIGTVLNLSLTTNITDNFCSVFLKNIIIKFPEITTDNIETLKDIKNTKILLNNKLIGYTSKYLDFIKRFCEIRKNGLIHYHVSIGYDDIDDEINIYSDGGRLIRPIFNLEKGNLTFHENDNFSWEEMIQYNHITYIDHTEINNKVIAFSQSELSEYKYDYCEIHPSLMLGVMTSIIPFSDHSQSPRNVYQASMGKQAMSMYALSFKNRVDTIVNVLNYPQKPLVNTKAAEFMNFDVMPSGINVIVAIACYTGYNQEDSILMNKAAVERGLFHSTSYRTIVTQETKQGTYNLEVIRNPSLENRRNNLNYNLLDSNGIVRKGSIVYKNDVLIGKVFIKKNKVLDEVVTDVSVFAKKNEIGIVDRVVITTDVSGFKLVKVVIRNLKIPEIGDKFASRSAQKGTVGMIFSSEDMPFSCSGIIPDIVINAHCIPSRMTINQLLECVLGKSASIHGEIEDSTPFTEKSKTVSELISEKLKSTGFECNGFEQMYNGFTGEPMDAKIFIGPTYYQRLKHLVSEKIHARSSGNVTTLVRQPQEGRSRDGGLRFGEMERDAVITHGTSKFLKERLYEYSDKFEVPICNKCGNFSNTLYNCNACNTDDVSIVNLPYASKLLLQELNCMGIKTKMSKN